MIIVRPVERDRLGVFAPPFGGLEGPLRLTRTEWESHSISRKTFTRTTSTPTLILEQKQASLHAWRTDSPTNTNLNPTKKMKAVRLFLILSLPKTRSEDHRENQYQNQYHRRCCLGSSLSLDRINEPSSSSPISFCIRIRRSCKLHTAATSARELSTPLLLQLLQLLPCVRGRVVENANNYCIHLHRGNSLRWRRSRW